MVIIIMIIRWGCVAMVIIKAITSSFVTIVVMSIMSAANARGA